MFLVVAKRTLVYLSEHVSYVVDIPPTQEWDQKVVNTKSIEKP